LCLLNIEIDKELNKVVIRKFIRILEAIHTAIQNIKDMEFVSSSLLMVYDASKDSLNEAIIKLIDFENAKQSQEQDKDILEGIENLSGVLREIYEEI